MKRQIAGDPGMKRRTFVAGVAALTIPLGATAQQSAFPVIGFLNGAAYELSRHLVRAFHEGLAEAGYVEGRNVTIEYRSGEGQYGRLPALAADLAGLNVNVIVATGTPTGLPAKAATTSIPIVFVTGSDPIEQGLVTNLNRPTGNLTGTTTLAVELGRKRMELLRELVPSAKLMGVLINPTGPNLTAVLSDMDAASRTVGLPIHIVHASTERDLETAFASLVQRRVSALIIGTDTFFNSQSGRLAALTVQYALPAVYQYREFVEAGGLMSYAGSITDAYHVAGVYTGRILKGAKPSDLPVQQSRRAELFINARTAKAPRPHHPAVAPAAGGSGGSVNRRAVLSGLVAAAVARPLAAEPQHRIGFVRVGQPPPPWVEAFRQGLRERGHVEGQSFVIDFGIAGNAAQLPQMAAEVVARKVDVLIASGTPSVVPAKNATQTIPVVFVAAVDPVAAGITASLARPGGNVTGITAMHADLVAKRLAVFKELLPNVARFVLLARADSPATRQYVKEAEHAAQTLNVQLRVLSLRDPSELDALLGSIQVPSALVVADDAVFTTHRRQIAELALKNRLPTAYGFSDMVEAGGLIAYGPDYGEMYRRAAFQVDKLLKGTKAADLPVEQPSKFEMVINLKTAHALGLTIPPSLLLRADQVIE